MSAQTLTHGLSHPPAQPASHQMHVNCHEPAVMQPHQQLPHASCALSPHQTAQHLHCQDCSSLHCNSLQVILPVLGNAPQTRLKPALPQPGYNTYTAQHLPGYWQEILRPPKA